MTTISKSEFEVMEAIWQNYPCSANDVVSRLQSNKEWHEKTVKTLLGRLVKKGAVSADKSQRHYLYSPLLNKEEYQLSESKSLIDRVFSGSLSPLVAGFAKQKNLEKTDIQALKKIIQDWESEND